MKDQHTDNISPESMKPGKDALPIQVEPLDIRFSVCKVSDYSDVDIEQPFVFTAITDEEKSLVCPVESVPDNTLIREDGWRAFRVCGVLDFSLIGILARIAGILAERGISIFAVSTYNTDYILTKEENFDKALNALREERIAVLPERAYRTLKEEVYPFNQADPYGRGAAGWDEEPDRSYMTELYAAPDLPERLIDDDTFMNILYAPPEPDMDFVNDPPDVQKDEPDVPGSEPDMQKDEPDVSPEKAEDRKAVYCMHCGRKIPENSRFCIYCGRKQKIAIDPEDTILFCSNCLSQISPLSIFCPYCGTRTSRVREREQENIMNVLYGAPPLTKKKGLSSKIGDLLKRK